MRKLIRGLREFKDNHFPSHLELFEKLGMGQKPRVLFITCSDSRIDPNLLTKADVGELFIMRNAGNIIPPYGSLSGEGATIEYAIQSLEIEQVIVCGHTHCGAMNGLLKLEHLREEMPIVYEWLKLAEGTRRLVKENYSHLRNKELLEITSAENVLTQIDHLKTYPLVRSRLYQGRLNIYGWVYNLETGEVLAYDPVSHSYMPPQHQLVDDLPEPSLHTDMSDPLDSMVVN
ncbi:carbonic anhydrase [Pseudanabaena sp. ABRG5-3]|jgi:carbonic anhydrase|uniref:carbonic anhydrase n=1 Tax=Pseudanabaena sp. ABRG5-3 TaxID=685565 RepID=UPI000DC73534|nr:carbonic anhydrase [Pseudanabaena sp. ABRG5-3]BBC26350.1 carbonic anhydrase [Pseudanabaena sp. ABRG5-3]